MKRMSKCSLVALYMFLIVFNAKAQFQDTSLSVDARVDDLISQMTLAEKISQLGHNSPAISRLGISSYYYWNEAIHGVARSGLATSFPVSIALSSTWNPDLIYQVATAVSDEARVKNNTESKGLTYWCPTINMARDPRWGRSEENYGEDVYLTSQIAVSFIRGMQGNDPKYLKTVATAKHFACNNVETNRHSISSNADERSLREYYLPAFKACVTEGNVYSIMSAYNALNGVPSPANRTLLTHILRSEWGFTGFVVSDCGAINDIWENHNYVATAPEATSISILNGNDLNCGSIFPNNADSAISRGLLTEVDIDKALKRVFKARFLLGEFDPASSVPYTSIPDSQLDCQANRNLALRAAREAIVLMKNENAFLPLTIGSIDTIAVIGPNANTVQLGGYSGTPSVSVSPLQAIATKFGTVVYVGIIEAENFSGQNGIKTEVCSEGGSNIGYIENGDYVFYNNINFDTGKVKLDLRIASNTSGGYVEVVLDNSTGQSLGTYTVPGTGGWQAWTTLTVDIPKTSGIHNVYLKFTGTTGFLFNVNWLKFYNVGDIDPAGDGPVCYALGCYATGSLVQAEIDKAVALAKKADVAIVVCGTDLSVANESLDRTSINMPGAQEQLIKEVYHANPKTILVLVTGASLAINWAQDSIPAILTAWYDGQSQGTAITDVIFGDYNPGGKLTTTWYKSTTDLPAMADYDIKNNRTYMYFNGTPLYPFGYGLSYTEFSYNNLTFSSTSLNSGESIKITADITNTGDVAGDEVAQLYVHVNSSSIKKPIKELKGFSRINLQSDSTKTVTFELKHEDLQYYDKDTRTFRVEDGDVDIFIGSSSDDIRLDSQIVLTGGTISSTYRQDPFMAFEAENFENKSRAVSVKSCLINNLCANLSGNNSYVAYKNFDFDKEARQFNAHLASVNPGSQIDVVVDSLDGEVVGTLPITPTADLETFEVKSCVVTGITGIRDIYLVLKGEASSVCKLDWFYFQDTITTDMGEYNTPAKLAGYQCSLFPNPSSSDFIVNYNLPEKTDVVVEIYTMDGILTKSIHKNEQDEGSHQFEIDTNSEQLNSGLYIVEFKANYYNKSLLLNIIK